jgi:hypothetical protein
LSLGVFFYIEKRKGKSQKQWLNLSDKGKYFMTFEYKNEEGNFVVDWF